MCDAKCDMDLGNGEEVQEVEEAVKYMRMRGSLMRC